MNISLKIQIDGISEVDFAKAQWRLLAQTSQSKLSLECLQLDALRLP